MNFLCLNFPTNQRKIWQIYALESKKRWNQQNEGTYVFVGFSENLKTSKFHSEIKWPLDLNTLWASVQSVTNIHLLFCNLQYNARMYSRVHISSVEVFTKILNKSSIVAEINDTSYELVFIEIKHFFFNSKLQI